MQQRISPCAPQHAGHAGLAIAGTCLTQCGHLTARLSCLQNGKEGAKGPYIQVGERRYGCPCAMVTAVQGFVCERGHRLRVSGVPTSTPMRTFVTSSFLLYKKSPNVLYLNKAHTVCHNFFRDLQVYVIRNSLVISLLQVTSRKILS